MKCVGKAAAPILILCLSGCATYSALSLPGRPDLAASDTALTVPGSRFATPGVRITQIDLRQPLDGQAVAALAVLNNPELIAERTEQGVADAQSYAAGLLPWPEFTIGQGRPDAGAAGLVNPWALSLDEATNTLIQHGQIERAAAASQRGINLAIVWNEWQVAQRARLLYAGLEEVDARIHALQPVLTLYADRVHAARIDVQSGALSHAAATSSASNYTALLALQSTLDVKRIKVISSLKALLGLAPDAVLALALHDHPLPVTPAELKKAIAALPHRRPDLMALAARYDAGDARLRQAILAQFPLIGVGIAHKRDTEGVVSSDLALTFNLPFLNDSRGDVAVARAQRLHLHAVYQARLDEAVAQVTSLESQSSNLAHTLAQLQKSLTDMPAIPSTALTTVPFNTLGDYLQQREIIASKTARLRNALDRCTIALETLLGMPILRSRTPHSGST